MSKIYTKNGDRISKSTDWVTYYYSNVVSDNTFINLTNYSVSYWEDVRQVSPKNHNEEGFKKRSYTIYSDEKSFDSTQEKRSIFSV